MYHLIKNPFERKQKGAVLALCVMFIVLAGIFVSCAQKGDSSPSEGIYYVVGFDGTAEVNDQEGTAKSGGYLFISENLQDSLLANNRFEVEKGEYWDTCYRLGDLLDGIIDIPEEAFINNSACGFQYFPEEYRFSFKVQINSYRPMTEEEFRDVPRLVFHNCAPTFHISHDSELFPFKHIVITSISKTH